MARAEETAPASLRISDVYPVDWQPHAGRHLCAADAIKWEDIAQGTHPDCFFIAAVTALCAADPRRIEALFIEDEAREDGRYRLRFFRGADWVEVTCDDRIVMNGAGGKYSEPRFARSPTGRWWPLLLEKAYAEFYGGAAALAGGNMAECLHDLTGMPVRTITFANAANPKGDTITADAWARLAAELDAGSAAICAGTLKSFEKMKGNGYGLQPAHAYCVWRLVPVLGFAVLINPNKKGPPYTGPLREGDPKLSKAMRAAWGITGEPRNDWFAIPLDVLTQHFTGLHVALLATQAAAPSRPSGSTPKQAASLPLALTACCEGRWESQATASVGGCTSYTSFTRNPKFILANISNKAVEVTLVLKQAEQRCLANDAKAVVTKDISYLPAAINVVTDAAAADAAGTTPHVVTSPHLTPTRWQDVGGGPAPRYLNQRDVSRTLSVAPGAFLVVPALDHPLPAHPGSGPATAVRFTLLAYSPDPSAITLQAQGDAVFACTAARLVTTIAAGTKARAALANVNAAAAALHGRGVLHVAMFHSPNGGTSKAAAPAPDTVTEHYLSLSLIDTRTGNVLQCTPAINYSSLSLSVPLSLVGATDALTVEVHAAKLKGTAVSVDIFATVAVLRSALPPKDHAIASISPEVTLTTAADEDVAAERITPVPPPIQPPSVTLSSRGRGTGGTAPAGEGSSTRGRGASTTPSAGGVRARGGGAATGATGSRRGPAAGNGAAAVRQLLHPGGGGGTGFAASGAATRNIASLYAGLE
jgi:hypothetical protein